MIVAMPPRRRGSGPDVLPHGAARAGVGMLRGGVRELAHAASRVLDIAAGQAGRRRGHRIALPQAVAARRDEPSAMTYTSGPAAARPTGPRTRPPAPRTPRSGSR